MTTKPLTIHSSAPAAQVAGSDPFIATFDFGHIDFAVTLLQRAHRYGFSEEGYKDLLEAVGALTSALSELTVGLGTGHIAVVNYPVEGAHLDQQ